MARERIIEGTWNCTSCGSEKILARHKQCPSCGHPREEGKETDFDFGERSASGGLEREEVTDTSILGLASVGPDWFCAFCQTANRGDATTCRNCAAAREEGKVAEVAPLVAPIQPLASPAPTSPRAAGCLNAQITGRMVLGCLGVLGLGFALLLVLGYWATRTHEHEAKVARVSWWRTVTRQTYTQVRKQGWRTEFVEQPAVMPVEGQGERGGATDVQGCRRLQRSTRQVPDGTREVCQDRTRSVACGTTERCHVEKQGNGFAKEVCDDVTKYCSESYRDCRTETRYRDEPVYDIQCSYTTWEWQGRETMRTAGADDPPRWPGMSLGPLDRSARTENYVVVIEYVRKGKTGSLDLKPSTEPEFLAWRPGQPVTAVIDNTGEVMGLRRPGETKLRPVK